LNKTAAPDRCYGDITAQIAARHNFARRNPYYWPVMPVARPAINLPTFAVDRRNRPWGMPPLDKSPRHGFAGTQVP
jgi:hypothetical protein